MLSLIFNENPWNVVHLLTLIPIDAIFPSFVQTPVSSSLEKAGIENIDKVSIITFSIFRTNGTTFFGSSNLIIG